MANTVKKNSIAVSYKMDAEIVDMINKLSEETGITKTKIVEKSIKNFYNDYMSKQDNGSLI